VDLSRRQADLTEKAALRLLFLVGEGGFGPPKSKTTDLQGKNPLLYIPPYKAHNHSNVNYTHKGNVKKALKSP